MVYTLSSSLHHSNMVLYIIRSFQRQIHSMLSSGFVKDIWWNHIKNTGLKNRLEHDKCNSVLYSSGKNLIVSWSCFLWKSMYAIYKRSTVTFHLLSQKYFQICGYFYFIMLLCLKSTWLNLNSILSFCPQAKHLFLNYSISIDSCVSDPNCIFFLAFLIVLPFKDSTLH